MTEPTGSAFIQARVTLVPTDAGGRSTGIANGYRCNCRVPGHSEGEFFDATFHIQGAAVLEPGATLDVRIQPHHPDDWRSIEVGSVIEMCEGPRLIGRAIVTSLFGDSSWMID